MRWGSIVPVAHLVLLGIGTSSAIPNVKRVIIGRVPKQPAKEVFRGDFRSPAEVAIDGGFRPRGDYANDDRAFSIYRHMGGEFWREDDSELSDEDSEEEWISAFVSVTTDVGTGASYGRWLYRIHATPNMIDPTAENENEPEIFALGGVPWSQVMGWYYVRLDGDGHALNPDAITAADFTPNPAYQGRYDQFALTTVEPRSRWRQHDRSYWTQFMNRPDVGPAVGFTGQFPLQLGTYSLEGLPGPSSANGETQINRPPAAAAQAPALNEDDIVVAAEFLRDHNAPCDVSGADPETQWLTLEADSTIARALARMQREGRPNQTLPSPIEEADEQIRIIIERLQRGQEPSTCQLVGECSGLSFSHKKRAAAPAGLSNLCQRIHRPTKDANGLDDATQNSEKCVLRSPINVKVQLSDATSAGSWDRLFLEIGKNPKYDKTQPHYLLKEAPDAGDLMSEDVDLADAYTMKAVTINDIKRVKLVSRLDTGRVASNELMLQDITITAKCAASPKVAEFHKAANEWFTSWGTEIKPTDWSWKKDCDRFKSLKFKWHLGGAVRAGTWDDLKLGVNRDHKVTAHDIQFAQSPAARDSGEMEINLKDTYGSATVPIEKVDYFRVYSTTRWPDSGEDEWELGGIRFTAQCEGYDKAVIMDKFGSDYNWHSRSNGKEMPVAASDWRWEDENLQTRHPFPREEL
ncbi:heat-labile enterotoxin IIB, A chain [Metarhizium acridum CQMa 102]|uniref:Heat-labile enterotoxin IIB, A chain n=1 Tax=Metarhizium acridum (strain CQMa 102) TaxID=655827 RepID=E9EE21_METAQ|nr:heat-labile enterotoxin IIB, A chain [Metarhizium acridum CQMa 102]EFY85860.1 heat-labile enterotoxin IIB, A chain [Metarhizium acridum CQMa 102]